MATRIEDCLLRAALQCNHCGKKKGIEVAKLSPCPRCGEHWYCGLECQLAAWQREHETECRELARSRLEHLIGLMDAEYGGASGTGGVTRFLKRMASMAPFGQLETRDLELLNVLKLLCKTLAGQVAHAEGWYLMSLTSLTILAESSFASSRKKAEKLLKEVLAALEKHRTTALANLSSDTATFFFTLASMSMRLLNLLGRKAEAVVLGRLQLPSIETLAGGVLPRDLSFAAMYLDDLAELVLREAQDVWSQHFVRNQEAQGNWGFREHEMAVARFTKGQAEAEALAKKALMAAEKARIRGEELFKYLLNLASILTKRKAFSEALPYARRAYDAAPANGLNDAAQKYAEGLYTLGNYTEAEKVLRRSLAHIPEARGHAGVSTVALAECEGKIHLRLGRLMLHRGRLQEALSHARQARALTLAHLPEDRRFAMLLVSPIWDLGGDVLEKMGKLEEAREWDHEGAQLTGTTQGTAKRRAIQELVRMGDYEKATQMAVHELLAIKQYRLIAVHQMLPSEEDNTTLEAYAEVLETVMTVSGGDPETEAIVQNIRADVAETRAIREALCQRLLQEFREEAAAARISRANGRSRKQGKKGKGRKKKGRKGKRSQGGKKKDAAAQGEDAMQRGGAAYKAEAEARGGGGEEEEEEEGEEEEEEEGKEEEEKGPPECAICLMELEEDDDEVTKLACPHSFHRACVTQWVQRCAGQGIEGTCPMCRAAIMY